MLCLVAGRWLRELLGLDCRVFLEKCGGFVASAFGGWICGVG